MRHSTRVWSFACALAALPALAQAQQLVYTSINPCRIVDTRSSNGGPLVAGASRTFHVVGATSDFAAQGGTAGGCGIPGFAGNVPVVTAVVFNLVAVNPSGAGNLRAWATDQAVPTASVLNYAQVTGLNIANAIIVPVRQDTEGNDLSVRADVSNTQLVVDVVGYFKPLVIADADLPVVPIAKGGTGSTTQNFVDLSTAQTVAGDKTFSNAIQVNGALTTGSPALVPVVATDANMRIVRGVVTGNSGGACLIQLGTGFTCVRNGVGNYTITFTTPFSSLPVPVAMPVQTTLFQNFVIGTSSMTFQTVNPSNVAADSVFGFIVIGGR